MIKYRDRAEIYGSELKFNDRKSGYRVYLQHELKFNDRKSGLRGVLTGLNLSLTIGNRYRA